MKNLLLLLVLANVLYFLWGWFVEEPPQPGVAMVDESELGPALEVTADRSAEAVASIGAVLGSGEPSDLEAVVGRSCVTIGPFRASEDADSAQTLYSGKGMRAQVRSAVGQIFVGHWVQIRNIESRDAGNATLAKLQEGGLGDAYLWDSDDEGLKISLGLFGDIAGAEKIELQATSLGFNAEIVPRTNEGSVYFVDIALPPGRGASEIIEQYGEDRVQLRDAATCPQSQ
jgi:hypothetical protein